MKTSKLFIPWATAVVALGAGLVASASVTAATLTADLSKTTTSIPTTMFGHIIEDISHSVEGGLNANLVRNSTLKENGSGSPPASWSVFTAGGGTGTVALDTAHPLNAANPNALKLSVTANGAGQRVGAANAGHYGVGLKPSTTYTATFFARADSYTGPISVSLEGTSGTVYAKASVPAVSSTWTRYSVSMTTAASTPVSSTNRVVLSVDGAGNGAAVYFNVVQVLPPTFGTTGVLQNDLMTKLASIKPGFWRVPGGNYLEGLTIATRFNWKNTIGPIESRPGHQNDAWGYWSTDQVGLKAYLDMAEQTGSQPLLAVYAGYSINQQVVAQANLGPYVQDALDQIQYVIGDTSTTWGAKRAADGHPAPYPLRYVEIGNEDFYDNSGSYNAYRYAAFYDAIKAAYPKLLIVATQSVTSRPMDVLDEHYYNGDTRYFTNVRQMYDNTPRNGPKRLVGEYATTNGTSANPTGTLAGAVSEAGFMIGMVRNADVVMGGSYAPALANVNSFQWPTNLIGFDASSSYASPSFWVQQLFGNNTGDHVVSSSLAGADSNVSAIVTRTASGKVFVVVANPTTSPVSANVVLNGATSVSSAGTSTTITGSPDARNSITAPTVIAPTTSTFSAAQNFSYTFPATSVTALQLNATGSASPLLTTNKTLSLHVTTPGYTQRSVAVSGGYGVTSVVTAASSDADRLSASFWLRPGLADSTCYSLESRTSAGSYLRHSNYRVELQPYDNSSGFAADATFCARQGNSGEGISLQAYNYPTRYLRHYSNQLYIASNGGPLGTDASADWAADTSFTVSEPWWRSDVSVPLGKLSLGTTSAAYSGQFLRQSSLKAVVSPISSSSTFTDKADATFTLVKGLADSSCYSFVSVSQPGYYLRHANYAVRLDLNDNTNLFSQDATFCATVSRGDSGISWQAFGFPARYLRNYNGAVYIASNGGPLVSDAAAGWANDTGWITSPAWAP